MERLTLRDDDGRALLTPYGLSIYCSMQATADCICKLEEALQVQGARLITLKDFEQADAYGYIPVWQECKIGGGYYTTVPVGILDYGEKGIYRYWTSKPSLKQMEETPWE